MARQDPPENYVQKFREAGGNFPAIVSDLENNPEFKKKVKEEAERLDLDPNTLWTNLMEEGAYSFFRTQEDLEEESVDWNESIYRDNPVEYEYAGLDTIGSRLNELVSKGYVSEDLASKYQKQEMTNERGQKVSSIESNDLSGKERMLNAVSFQAAEMRDRQDKIQDQAKQLGYDLSNDDLNYLTFVSYNGGQGSANQVLQAAKQSNVDSISDYVKDRQINEGERGGGKKIDPNKLPDLDVSGQAREAMQNADRRLRNQKAFKEFNIFGLSEEKRRFKEKVSNLNVPEAAGIDKVETNNPLSDLQPDLPTGEKGGGEKESNQKKRKQDIDLNFEPEKTEVQEMPAAEVDTMSEKEVQNKTKQGKNWFKVAGDETYQYKWEGDRLKAKKKGTNEELNVNLDKVRDDHEVYKHKNQNKETMRNTRSREMNGFIMQGGPQPNSRIQKGPLPERKLFLGGVTDAVSDVGSSIGGGIKDASVATGEFVKRNPKLVGTIGGTIAGAAFGNPMLGTQIGGLAGKTADAASGDATGAAFKRKERRRERQQKRANQMARRRAMRSPANGGNTAGSLGGGSTTNVVAHGGYIQDKYARGGSVENMEQDAKKFKGPKHENGGVQLDPQTEVEGGETMDKVNGSDYVFSERLRVPDSILPEDKSGMTFADFHEYLVENDASQSEIDELASIQERVAGRDQEGQSISRREVGSNKDQETKNQKKAHKGPLKNTLENLDRMRSPSKQELNNGLQPEEPAKRAYGGEKKYGLAGFLDDRRGENVGFGQATDQSMLPGDVSNIPGLGNRTGSTEDFVQDATSEATSSSSGLFNSGILTGENAQRALPFLPAAMNLGRAAFEDSDVPDVPFEEPAGRAEDTTRRMETDVNVEPQIAAVDKNFRSIIADPNASLNQKRAAASQASQQKAGIRSKAENRETGLQNQMLSRLSGLQARRDQAISQGRTQAAQAERRQQLKADEQQMNLLQTGLQQASNTFQRQQARGDQQDLQSKRLAVQLASIPPEKREGIMELIRNETGINLNI